MIGDMARRVPDRDRAPFMLDAFRRALVDPAAHIPLQDDRGARVAAARVSFGPPGIDLLGPGAKRHVDATAHDDCFPNDIFRTRRAHRSAPSWPSATR